MYVRRRPTLPHRHQCSTIGAEGLSFRVRNGAGRFPFAMTAVTLGRYSLGSQQTHTRIFIVLSNHPLCVGGWVCVPDRIPGTAQWTRRTTTQSLLCIKLSAY